MLADANACGIPEGLLSTSQDPMLDLAIHLSLLVQPLAQAEH